MNWKPAFAIALFGVTAICYLGGQILENRSDEKKKRLLCIVFAVLGLLPLLVFKYYNFLNDSIGTCLEAFGVRFVLPGLNWAIPIGISFFTFQAVGCLLDVYHKRVPMEKNFADFALFVSFFPQVTSGPISTAKELMPQFKTPHKFNFSQGAEGLKLLLWGMFLKCVVADRLGMYVDTVYANYERFSGLNCFIASLFYSIQIYGDFAGYSLMAVGIAKTLGFELINNFNRPFLSTSITEFWKRWHISLTRWLTTHVYFSLGGNRCGKLRQYCNIIVTFLVSGLWHGANWTFVVWGAIHGVLQVVEKALGLDPKGKYAATLKGMKWLKPVRILVTFLLVSFAWIFFRMPTIGDAWCVIERIFTDHTTQAVMEKANNQVKLFSMVALMVLLIAELRSEFLRTRLAFLDNKYMRFAIYVLLFVMILCVGVLDAGQFIYVSF